MHSSRNLRSILATNKLELLDLSCTFQRPTSMLMAAHGYTAAAHKCALHDSRPCRHRARQPVRPRSALCRDALYEIELLVYRVGAPGKLTSKATNHVVASSSYRSTIRSVGADEHDGQWRELHEDVGSDRERHDPAGGMRALFCISSTLLEPLSTPRRSRP